MEEFLDERESAAISNKCSSCGAALEFDIESGELKCTHCGTIKDIEDDTNVQRRELSDEILKAHSDWKEGAVFRCDNCGAKSVLNKISLAKSCAFCGSSHIVELSELAGVKPDSVIPFQITKQGAWEKFRKWIKSRFFAPSYLKREDTSNQFNALYSSSWSFSASTASDYRGTLGKTVTTTRRMNGKTVTRSHTKWFNVSGAINQDYADYFVQSGERIPVDMFARIKPFNLNLLKVYKQEYLAGIIAEHYTRTIEICFKDFESFIKRDLRNKIMSRHNADRVSSLTINTAYSNKKFNYILLPIYIASFNYKKKLYNFYVNGATGKVAGKYPKSPLKVFFTALITAAIVGAVAFAVMLWEYS